MLFKRCCCGCCYAISQLTGANYGRIVSGKPPFEELALLLVESGEPEALQVFLQTKLQVREGGDVHHIFWGYLAAGIALIVDTYIP